MKALLALLALAPGITQAGEVILFTKHLNDSVTWKQVTIPNLPFSGLCLETAGNLRWDCLLLMPDNTTQRWWYVNPGKGA